MRQVEGVPPWTGRGGPTDRPSAGPPPAGGRRGHRITRLIEAGQWRAGDPAVLVNFDAGYDGDHPGAAVQQLRRAAARATVDRWLVLGAEQFTRQRLRALAHAERHATGRVPSVLFLCVHNAGCSQMALGWFT